MQYVTHKLFQRETQLRLLQTHSSVFCSDSSRGRPSQAEGQGEAETIRLSPRFQAELIVLYILGRAEGRGSRAERSPIHRFSDFFE